MSKRTLPSLTLPSLLSDLSALSSQPSLLPALPPAATAPSSPDLSSGASSSPSALAVQVAEEFIKSSNVLLDKVEMEVVEGLRERIDEVEKGVREVKGGLEPAV